MIRYFSTGLYSDEVFYTKHMINFSSDDLACEDVECNWKLLAKHYRDNHDFTYENEEDEREQVHAEFWESLCLYNFHYEPLVFNEEIALECGLTPFTYQEKGILALSGCGMNLSPKLDAYQAMTDGTIDKYSKLFSDRNYFEYVVGKDMTRRVLEVTHQDTNINQV